MFSQKWRRGATGRRAGGGTTPPVGPPTEGGGPYDTAGAGPRGRRDSENLHRNHLLGLAKTRNSGSGGVAFSQVSDSGRDIAGGSPPCAMRPPVRADDRCRPCPKRPASSLDMSERPFTPVHGAERSRRLPRKGFDRKLPSRMARLTPRPKELPCPSKPPCALRRPCPRRIPPAMRSPPDGSSSAGHSSGPSSTSSSASASRPRKAGCPAYHRPRAFSATPKARSKTSSTRWRERSGSTSCSCSDSVASASRCSSASACASPPPVERSCSSCCGPRPSGRTPIPSWTCTGSTPRPGRQ